VALLIEKNPKLFSVDTRMNGIFSKDVFDFWRPTGHRVPIVDGKYSVECYLEALEAAASHFRSNLGIPRGQLLEHLDYVLYHMPFTAMARKAHRHLLDVEHAKLTDANREALFRETFHAKVEPGLLGAREVGNIYTGSVYMGLASLLETEGERVEDKQVGVFSYGSGCGAEFFLCQMRTGISGIIQGMRFQEQLDRRKPVTFEQYVQWYSRSRAETLYSPEEVEAHKDPFTRFIFIGFKDHKRQYV
jgi:hydroxymethylglutaryl-CoA synthase